MDGAIVATDLAALLNEPSLGLEVVAGTAGIHRRGPLRWVHISELPDPTPWLEGGEILLTTGLGIRDSPGLQRALVAGLDRRGCVAVGFGVGIWIDDVPDALRDEADARGLPVFKVPYEVPFIAVTKYVSGQVFAAHYAGLRRALDLHRRVLAVVTSSGGLGSVLSETVRSIGGVGAVVFDAFGHVLDAVDPDGHVADADTLWHALPADRRARAEVDIGERVASVIPLRAADDVQALLVVVGDHPLDDASALLAQQGAAAATVEISRGVSARKTRRAAVSELLDDAQEGRASQRRLRHRFEQWGVDITQPFHALTVLSGDARHAPIVAGLLEDMTGPDVSAAVGADGDTVHAIVQPATATLGADLVAETQVRGMPRPRVGRSHVHRDAGGLSLAVRESLAAAARSDGGLRNVADIGVDGLLAGVGADVAADTFIRQTLGPVLDHDAAGDGALVDTLRAYLDRGCRPGPAAADLRVHRHTLTYRLDRIAQLTGRDPRSGDHLLAYGLALELLAQRGPPS